MTTLCSQTFIDNETFSFHAQRACQQCNLESFCAMRAQRYACFTLHHFEVCQKAFFSRGVGAALLQVRNGDFVSVYYLS